MKTHNIVYYLIFIRILLINSLIFSQTKNIIDKLPNGVSIGNYNVSIYNANRDSGNVYIQFICRKISHSDLDFPFTTIRLIDDHGNEYFSKNSVCWNLNNSVELYLKLLPLGFTWTFVKSVEIPNIAPIAKLDFILSKPTIFSANHKLIKRILFNINNIKPINIAKELNLYDLSELKPLIFNKKNPQGKHLEWYIDKIDTEKWLMPIYVFNKDYVPRNFGIFFLFQFSDGSLSPECPPEITQLESGGYLEGQNEPYLAHSWTRKDQLPASENTFIGNYCIPNNSLHIFVFNGIYITKNYSETFLINEVYHMKL